MIHIYINNQDNILTSGYNGDITLFPSQTRLQNLNICDSSIKYDEHFSVLDCSSYILYKYDISNMDSTSFYFHYLCINQQYHSDNTTYYINRIDIKNNLGFLSTYSDNYYFNGGTMYPINCPPIGKDKVTYININFTQQPRVTSAPSSPTMGPTKQSEYQIYLHNNTNKSNVEECFSPLQPDFKLGFNFSDYGSTAIPITYNISKRTLETTQSFIDSVKFSIVDNDQAYIDIILNSDGYTLKEITKDVSYNNIVIYNRNSQDYNVTNNIISLDTSGKFSQEDNTKEYYTCISNTKCVPQLYIKNNIKPIDLVLEYVETPLNQLNNTIEPISETIYDLTDNTFFNNHNNTGNVITYLFDSSTNIMSDNASITLSNIVVASANYDADDNCSYTLYYDIKRDNEITQYTINVPAYFGCTVDDIAIVWNADTYTTNNTPVYLTFTKLEYNSGVSTQSYLNTSYNSYIQ